MSFYRKEEARNVGAFCLVHHLLLASLATHLFYLSYGLPSLRPYAFSSSLGLSNSPEFFSSPLLAYSPAVLYLLREKERYPLPPVRPANAN